MCVRMNSFHVVVVLRSGAGGRLWRQPFQGPIRKLLILNTLFLKNNLYYNL